MKRQHSNPVANVSSLVELLRWRAHHQPEQRIYTFLADGESEESYLTFGELDRKARALGARLQALGLAGERAVLLYPPGWEFVPAFFGCLYAGVVAVPVYFPRINRPMTRFRAIAANSQPRAVLTASGNPLERDRWLTQAPELVGLHWVVTDTINDHLAADWKDPGVDRDTLAFLQYTSGSTALPKGVMNTHGNLLHNSALIQDCLEPVPFRGVFWLPFYHDLGLIGSILQTLFRGGTSTIMPPVAFLQRPLRWLQAISRTRATISGGPNFAYDLCVHKITPEQRESLDLSSWSVAFSGAEPIRPETIERFCTTFAPCGLRPESFSPGYGLAEATLLVSGGPAWKPPVLLTVQGAAIEQNLIVPAKEGSDDARTLVGCGQLPDSQKVVVVDPATRTPCPNDRIGEVWVSGPSVAQGYWDNPEASEQTFGAYLAETGEGPFLRTGDLGFINGDQLYITGRLKDLIIIRGRNIYPQDVEWTVERSHPVLRASGTAAFAIEAFGDERLVVLQEIERHGKDADFEAVIQSIRQAVVEQHEIEVYAVWLLKPGTIPKTSSGKIQRRASRDAFLNDGLEAVAKFVLKLADPSPETLDSAAEKADRRSSRAWELIENWLISRLAKQLGIAPTRIDVRKPFATLGLGSLQAVTLAGDLQEWLGYTISPTLIYEYPTIEALVDHLSEETVRSGRTLRPESEQAASGEPIAIIGIGCRFPGASGPEVFWKLLEAGVDAIGEAPMDRWSDAPFLDKHLEIPDSFQSRLGGFLKRIDEFDAEFFGISPREAMRTDPQHRLLLEVAWEALEDAGQAPERLAGSSVGVFVGISTNDYNRLQWNGSGRYDPYSLTGNATSIAANRLSYLFDFHGPSLSIDSACSSSLVAVHLACQSLRNGEASLALAGGVNVILSPEISANFARAGFLSPDGRCKTFDARANGYVRGEGAGLVVLKPLSRAQADGDPIYAIIRGGAVNQDGGTNGLTAPSQRAQEAVLRAAYRQAGVRPAQVQYIEAHGTGTLLGDPIEARALGSVLAEGRPEGQFCAVGSVKTNIGHLEAAGGVAGLIKVALALKHRTIPPSLHFNTPNPLIPFETLPIRVQQALSAWPESNEPAIAGVSAFGFGGTNAHIVLEGIEPRTAALTPGAERPSEIATLLPLSARSEESLRDVARAYRDRLASEKGGDATSLWDIAYSAGVRRGHHDHRLALVSRTREEAIERLDTFLMSERDPRVATGVRVSSHRPRLAMVFSGQGVQWWGMGRGLFETEPVFHDVITQCDDWLQARAGWSLIEELKSDEASSRLSETEIAQPAMFAIQVGLAALWRSWGVVPDAVVGHSLGEVAAAHVARNLSLVEALRVVHQRGRLMQQVAGRGLTAAVELSAADARRLLAGLENRLSIAAINGPRSTTISGDPRAVQDLVTSLQEQGIFARLLAVDCAFHSPQMEPLRQELIEVLGEVECQPGSISLISTVTGKVVEGGNLDATHWGRNLRETVQFAAAVDALADDGYEVFLEIGPHPTLAGAISQALHRRRKEAIVLASLRREEDERETILQSLGALYAVGQPVNWSRLYPSGRFTRLPSYPWQRQRHWVEAENQEMAVRQVSFQRVSGLRHAAINGAGDSHGTNGNGLAVLETDEHRIPHQLSNGNGSNSTDDTLADLLYELQWQPVEPRSRLTATTPINGGWLIFADSDGIASALRSHLETRGAHCVTIGREENSCKSDTNEYHLNPSDRVSFRKLFDTLLDPKRPPCRGVVYLWGLDARSTDEASAAQMEAAQRISCGGLLHLVQALTGRDLPQQPRIWVVTRGAQPAGAGPAPVSVSQSPLWGMGRTISLEQPDLWGGLIDLDPAAPEGELERLLDVIGQVGGEGQLAFREGKEHAARLIRISRKPEHDKALPLRPDGTYLITGGLGGLGLQVAHWMVTHGARRLVLLGRRGLPDRREWDRLPEGSSARATVASIRALERLGATVMVASGDVGDEPRMAALLDDLANTLPPLRGIIHAAGVIQPQTIADIELETFLDVLRPKVSGTWALHRLTRDLPLDFFVLFSSVSSVWGSSQLVDYAAANHFLDACAHHRRALGLPGLSINWGPWAEMGMATTSDLSRSLELMGLFPLRPETAVRALSLLAGMGAPQATVADVDWLTFKVLYSQNGRGPFLDQISDRLRSGFKSTSPTNGLLANWREAPPAQRREWLIQYFRDRVGRVLGVEPTRLDPDRPLNTLGLGSLVAMELKSRTEADLGLPLPLASLFQGPTIRELADQMLERLTEPAPLQNTALAPARETVAEFPLSYNQQSLWYLNKLSPTIGIYHIAGAARIPMVLNVEALRRSFQRLVDRHGMLRTTFSMIGESLIQRVHEKREAFFHYEDAASWTDAEFRRQLLDNAYLPYDLERGPLLRAHVFRRSDREYILLLGIHHIISDFWSIAVILNEVGLTYPSECEGIVTNLPPLEFEYKDFVRWQAEMLASAEGERHWAFWQKQLSGPLPTLNLPTDRPRPAIQTHTGAEKIVFLDTTLTQRLVTLGASQGASLYITLLAAFQVMLSRYTGQEDIIVGSPVAGRNRPGLAGLVGDFVNTAPMRGRLAGDPTFEEFLIQIRNTVLNSLEHQDFPFSLMVDRLQPTRDPSRSPVFQVMFVFQKAQLLDDQGMTLFAFHEAGPTLQLGGLLLESMSIDQRIARLDLVLTTAVGDGRLATSIEYNTDLFNASTIDRMLEHYRILLEGIAANPRQRISDLPLLTPGEQRQLLQQWSNDQGEPATIVNARLASTSVEVDLLSLDEIDSLIASLSESTDESPAPDPDDLGDLSDEELDSLISNLSQEAAESAPSLDSLDQLSDADIDSLIILLSHEQEAIDE